MSLYRPEDPGINLYRPDRPTMHGSAAWASVKDLDEQRMLKVVSGKEMGPLIGCLGPETIGGHSIRYVYAPGEGHLLTVAPTRSGKGRGQIIPNLLWWPGSSVVLDLKGENYERTAGWREKNGHRVIRFEPFNQDSATWNPIEQVNYKCGNGKDDPQRQENARYLANLMITPNPNAKDPYWDNAAKTLLQGLMLFVATAPLNTPIQIDDKGGHIKVQERTMAEVRRLLTQSPKGFNDTLLAMALSEETWVRETAATMTQMAGAKEQFSSVKTLLMEHTTVWAYKRIQNVTSSSSFDFGQLRDETPTTIYLVIPFEALAEYRNLLRVMIGSCMRELRMTWSASNDHRRPPVLMFLDEFPQLAYMQPIEEALLYIGSYGVKFWFFSQDMSQLQQHYEKTWRQFIANCGTRCFFGASDLETARIVSEMSGSATIRTHSYQSGFNQGYTSGSSTTNSHGGSSGSEPGGGSSSSSWSAGTGTSTSTSTGSSFSATVSWMGRPLFMPDEVLRMPFGMMVGLLKGMPAFLGELCLWDTDTQEDGFLERGRIAPPTSVKSNF